MTIKPDHSKRMLPVLWAFDEGVRRGDSTVDRHILCRLCNYMDGGLVCWPSLAELAFKCGCSKRHVIRALHRFEADGLISITPGGRAGALYTTSVYRLIAPLPLANGADLFDGTPAAPLPPRVNGKLDTPPPKAPQKRKPRKPPGVTQDNPRKRPGVTQDNPPGVTQDNPQPVSRGDNYHILGVTPSHPESPIKNLPRRSTLLRSENAVAFSSPPCSDPDSHPDPREVLWTTGLSQIQDLTGQLTSQARRQIGKFLKLANGDCVAVSRALEAAVYEKPHEPIPWITAAIQARAVPRSFHAQNMQRYNLGTFLTPLIDPEPGA